MLWFPVQDERGRIWLGRIPVLDVTTPAVLGMRRMHVE